MRLQVRDQEGGVEEGEDHHLPWEAKAGVEEVRHPKEVEEQDGLHLVAVVEEQADLLLVSWVAEAEEVVQSKVWQRLSQVVVEGRVLSLVVGAVQNPRAHDFQ